MRPQKILVIDDSKLIHKMFAVMLRQYPLVHATDGLEGLERLRHHDDVDLILLDINMPNMDGFEFLDEVKATASLSEIPIVVVTTEGREEDTARAMEAGAVAYITKPFRAEEVVSVIERLEPLPSG